MESHSRHLSTPEKRAHQRRLSRQSSFLSVQSSSSQSSRESSASRSPCKQCLILKERMHDFYEGSIASRSMSVKSMSSDGDSSEGSPFVTPTKRWKNSPKHRQVLPAAPTSPILTSTLTSTPTTSLSKTSTSANTLSTPTKTTSSLEVKSVSTATQPLQTVTKRTMTHDYQTNNIQTSEFKMPKCPSKKTLPQESREKALKPKELFPSVPYQDRLYVPILLIFAIGILFLFSLIQSIQPNVFIDEFFHVTQSQQYCLYNNFTHWDNKITTPPGLYLCSYLFLKPLQYFSNLISESCSITQHRFTNIIFTFGNFLCLKSILREKGFSPSNSGLFGLTFALLPPLFFPFSLLYYTDVGSLFTLLILLKFSRHNLAVIPIGLISLLFRQTNIVWVFYIAAGGALHEFFTLLEDVVHFSRHEFFCAGFRSSFFRPVERNLSNIKYSVHFLLHLGWRVISQFYGFIFNAMVFFAFLYLNGGIVLGDRSAHEASFHLAQIPYFLTFCLIFALPILLSLKSLYTFGNFIIVHPFRLITLFSFLAICLAPKFTFVHPYLLADNRHYTFYLWKKVWFKNQWIRYLAVPLYGYVAFTMYRKLHIHSVLKKQNSPLKSYERTVGKALYILVLFVTIVPQQLIEFRYFVTPFMFWRLNIRRGFTALELTYFVAVNAITISIFCMKTIKYSDTQSNERIIW